MRNPIIFLIAMLCFGFSVSFCSTGWPNEPAGSTVITDCPFSGSICPTMFNTYKSGYFIVDPTAPTGGTNQVLDDYMPAGTSVGSGSGQWGTSFSPLAREVYTGAWWKTNSDFEGSHNNANKLWYVGGQPGNNSMLMWNGPMGLGTPRLVQFAFQTVENNCHVQGFSGDCWTPEYPSGSGGLAANVNSAAATIAPGSGWHQLELYQKASTTSTSRDGVVRWWVDGVLCGSYMNLNYSPGGFDNVQINHAWDGSHIRDRSLEWHHYWDQMRWSLPHNAVFSDPPRITSSFLAARTGVPYTATLAAEGGTKPYTWFLQSGSLPNGLTLNQSTGVISGTPTCVGRSDFTIRVTDGSSPALSATKSYTIITSGTGTCTSGMEKMKELTVSGLQLTAEPRTESVRFQLPQAGPYSLSVYDLSGREVWRNVGNVDAVWNHGGNLKNGVYLAKFSQGKQSSTVRFNVMN